VSRPDSLARFRELYVTTMRRQEADPFFYFPTEYWKALLADGGTLQPVLVEGRLDGRLVASLLCFAEGSRLHYHLGASHEAARSIGASNRCFLAAAEWAQARGVTRFHLGGGVGGSAASSLYVFKHRYDPDSDPLPFSIAKIVHDPVRYRELAGTDSTAGFFPPWRRTS
jgi:serine/alanine adding enzyme